jgi:AraC-like DNA-binding protein
MPPLANYWEFAPDPSLAGSVECFWAGTVLTASRAPFVHRVLPDGCMDLLFDFRAAGGGRASVIGTMTRPLIVATSGPVDLFGVRFRPGGFSRFLAPDAAEFTDARVDLANLWGQLAQEVWHRLGEATLAGRVRYLQRLLSTRANGLVQTDPFIHHCVARIEAARGNLRIGDLEKTTGLSARQLERKFKRHLGIAPKTFARVVRFKGVEKAVSALETRAWVTLAGDFGFADQPHLVREFKAFSGLTPSAYRRAIDRPDSDVGFFQDG